ncbi:zinc-dependent alcohol dehydrogenase family protein [Rhodovulum visakhapatnamense]|uniref:enoyl-[acyl-carrier-protein] reductase n=1 Tax=Rhodovulum visakhapatnamense TaxID=364297 RepID=A0A4R8FQX3_9RHOB|nr:NADPH:quinone reductase-like Zn-dependent oxidoreductase [Rhodovulum visakhapatnamense]
MPQDHSPRRTRKSFIYKSFGAPRSVLELIETERPPLASGVLRVEVTHVPVNPSDLIPITGAYAHRVVLPAVAGYEGVGRVVEAPAEFSHMLGRRVLPLRGEGTWQTHVDCPATCAVQVPDGISDLMAARAYINPLAAATMLRRWPVRDKTVLLCGAGSGCAEYLGRWAIRQGARHVVGIYRSESRTDRLRQIGIEPVSTVDSVAISRASTGADIAFDALGGDIASGVLGRMRRGADFVAYGLLTGRPVMVGAGTKASYHRFHLRDHLPSPVGPGMRDAFADIWSMLAETPPPDPRVFPARDWPKALAEAERPGGRKPILDMSGLA